MKELEKLITAASAIQGLDQLETFGGETPASAAAGELAVVKIALVKARDMLVAAKALAASLTDEQMGFEPQLGYPYRREFLHNADIALREVRIALGEIEAD